MAFQRGVGTEVMRPPGPIIVVVPPSRTAMPPPAVPGWLKTCVRSLPPATIPAGWPGVAGITLPSTRGGGADGMAEGIVAGGEGARGGTDAMGGGVELLARGVTRNGGGGGGRRSASSGVICVAGVAGARIAA